MMKQRIWRRIWKIDEAKVHKFNDIECEVQEWYMYCYNATPSYELWHIKNTHVWSI